MLPEPPVAFPAPAIDPQAQRRAELAWNLFTELRKELVEAQSLRTRVIGLKVTFVSAAAAVVAGLNHPEPVMMVIPAVAATFFDLLVTSYSFSIKRIGWYARTYLEPLLKKGYGIDEAMPLWQEFLIRKRTRQAWSAIANLGMTLLACAAAVKALYPFDSGIARTLGGVLLVLIGCDVWTSWRIGYLRFDAPKEAHPTTKQVPAVLIPDGEPRNPEANPRPSVSRRTSPFRGRVFGRKTRARERPHTNQDDGA